MNRVIRPIDLAIEQALAPKAHRKKLTITVNHVTYYFTDREQVRNLASRKPWPHSKKVEDLPEVGRAVLRAEAQAVMEFSRDFLRSDAGRGWELVTLYQTFHEDTFITGAIVSGEGVLDHFTPAKSGT